ncbi:MAG: DUF2164 domain-containing protein [Bacteroidota bacterium]
MPDINRKHDRLPDDKKQQAIDEIIYFFEHERDETIGRVAAAELLNFFLESIGKHIYNKGIADAKSALESRVDELRYDLDDLLEV